MVWKWSLEHLAIKAGIQHKYAKAVIASYERLGITPEYMIVGREAIIGKDDGIELPVGISENNITLGLIEIQHSYKMQCLMKWWKIPIIML